MSTPEIRVPCAEDRKWKVVEAIRARQSVAGTAIDAIDGVRVRQGSGWWLLRASNTQDILVVRCEAATRKDLAEIMDFLRRELADVALATPDVTYASRARFPRSPSPSTAVRLLPCP